MKFNLPYQIKRINIPHAPCVCNLFGSYNGNADFEIIYIVSRYTGG